VNSNISHFKANWNSAAQFGL